MVNATRPTAKTTIAATRARLAVAVGDAVPEVKKAAHFTTKALAGHGAIREAVELVLKSKGIWEEMIDKARA